MVWTLTACGSNSDADGSQSSTSVSATDATDATDATGDTQASSDTSGASTSTASAGTETTGGPTDDSGVDSSGGSEDTGAEVDCAGTMHTPGGSDGLGGCWPSAETTGVPVGVEITAYEGPCTLNSGNSGASVMIDGKDATACGILAIYDVDVTITRSIVPVIDRTNEDGSVDISDSVVTTSGWVGGMLWGSNITATRVDVSGGQHSVHCSDNCTIVDSWLHGQEAPEGEATHNNAFITNGGGTMVVRHNALWCSAEQNAADGGCTADLSLFGDFAPVQDITVDRNLFLATPSGGYCGSFGYNPSKPFGDNPSAIVVADNVFQRGDATGEDGDFVCGYYGSVTSYLDANGNMWSNNTYDDGEPIAAAR